MLSPEIHVVPTNQPFNPRICGDHATYITFLLEQSRACLESILLQPWRRPSTSVRHTALSDLPHCR